MNRFITFCLTVIFSFNVYANCEVKNNSMDHEENTARIYFGKVSILPDEVQPPGSIIKTGTAPASSFRDDNTVMWECDDTDAEKIHLLVAVNKNKPNGKDDYLHGRGNVPDMPNVYYTRIHRAGIKLIMENVVFNDNWQMVQLKNKPFDKEGSKIFIKLKNIPDVQAELIKLKENPLPPTHDSSCKLVGNVGWNDKIDHNDPILNCAYPNGYVQLAGFDNPNLHDIEGKPAEDNHKHMQAKNGFGYSIRNSIWVYNQPTCWVQSINPPVVNIPPINIQRIKNGEKSHADFRVTIKCYGNDFDEFGKTTGKTSMYFEMYPTTYTLISNNEKQLLDAPRGYNHTSTHLISNNYGTAGYAKGVGIKVCITKECSYDIEFVYNPLIVLDKKGKPTGEERLDEYETGRVSNSKRAQIDLNNHNKLINNIPAIKDENGINSSIYDISFTAFLEQLPGTKEVTTGQVDVSTKITLRVN